MNNLNKETAGYINKEKQTNFSIKHKKRSFFNS